MNSDHLAGKKFPRLRATVIGCALLAAANFICLPLQAQQAVQPDTEWLPAAPKADALKDLVFDESLLVFFETGARFVYRNGPSMIYESFRHYPQENENVWHRCNEEVVQNGWVPCRVIAGKSVPGGFHRCDLKLGEKYVRPSQCDVFNP